MGIRKDSRQWSDGFNESIVISVVLGIVFLCIATAVSEIVWLSIFGGIIFSFLSFSVFLKNHRDATYKFFLTDPETAKQVVESVLSQKNIPYEKDEHSYYLEEIVITVGTGLGSTYGPKGSVIKISPNKAIHFLLIKSLQEKIDVAFMPKGSY